MLDELVATTGYERKYAVALLRGKRRMSSIPRSGVTCGRVEDAREPTQVIRRERRRIYIRVVAQFV